MCISAPTSFWSLDAQARTHELEDCYRAFVSSVNIQGAPHSCCAKVQKYKQQNRSQIFGFVVYYGKRIKILQGCLLEGWPNRAWPRHGHQSPYSSYIFCSIIFPDFCTVCTDMIPLTVLTYPVMFSPLLCLCKEKKNTGISCFKVALPSNLIQKLTKKNRKALN